MLHSLKIRSTLSLILLGLLGFISPSEIIAEETKPVPPPPTVPASTIGALSDQIQKVLSANATLGQPIEIKNRTIVPVVSMAFGFGFGSCTGCSKMEAEGAMLNGGGGGWLSPQSLLIITENKVEVMEAKTSMIGEIIKSLTPIITEAIKSRQGRTQPPKEETPQKPPQ
ncbi:MAG TPA: spore germination protein GerW family protein [Candidatus Limnocylindrales bacterium]|nr:spore germination protein GerW family protein [Candidatus Limnocylindrales bacterium]